MTLSIDTTKHYMNMQILTTLPHYLAIIPVYSHYNEYTCIIFISTTCSVLYHYYEESNPFITGIDYFMALVWFLYDIYLANIYICNIGVFLLNISIPRSHYYFHAVWHIISACKCIYVSNRIRLDTLAGQPPNNNMTMEINLPL